MRPKGILTGTIMSLAARTPKGVNLNNKMNLEKIPVGNKNATSKVILTPKKCCHAQIRIYRKFHSENHNKEAEK